MKLIAALDAAGIVLIGEGSASARRRARRPAEGVSARDDHASHSAACAVLLGHRLPARSRSSRIARSRAPSSTALPAGCSRCSGSAAGARRLLAARAGARDHAAARPALARRAFPARCALRLLPRRGQSRRRGREPVRARLRPARAGAAARAAVLSGVPRRHEPRRARRRRVHLPRVVGVHVARRPGRW